MLAFEKDCKRYIDTITMGRSVISGASAMRMPLSLFPRSVSEMTKDNKGPGAMPAPRPRVMPYIKYSVIYDFHDEDTIYTFVEDFDDYSSAFEWVKKSKDDPLLSNFQIVQEG